MTRKLKKLNLAFGADTASGMPRTEFITWRRSLLTRMILLAVAVMLVGQVAVAWFSVDGFDRELKPQLSNKTQVVGFTIAGQIAFAVDNLGIPPAELVGMDAFFDKVLRANPDVEYLIFDHPSLRAPYARGLSPADLARILPVLPAVAAAANGAEVEIAGFTNRAFPVAAGRSASASAATSPDDAVLHVGVRNKYVRSRLSEIIYDVITVIVVSWLVTLELLTFFMSMRVSAPMERIEAALASGAKGLFNHRLALRTRDEIGRIVLSFNRMLRNLEQRYEDFHFESQELEGAQIDEGIARRIRNARQEIEKRYRFGEETMSMRNALQIRVPLFLFIFSEELSRSFLPLFIARNSPQSAIGNDLLIGLPITLFMLAAALVTMTGAGFAERFGARRVFLAGVGAAVAGYVGTFLVQSYYDLVLWRILTGAGYGLTFIATQAWVTENTGENDRARGMAVFVGAVFVGAVCGPPIGGIFADRIGFEATFLVSAGLAVAAAFIVQRSLQEPDRERNDSGGGGGGAEQTRRRIALGIKGWRTLLCDIRFLSVTVFSAVAGKLILTGFLFYLVPLYLSDLGNSQSAIGRIIMLYGVATIACTTLVARFADRTGQYARIIAGGGLLAAFGCFAVLVQDAIGGATNAILFATALLGVSHAMSLTSQLAVIQQVADRHRATMGRASVIGAYRLVERGGLVLGPLVAGALVTAFGYTGAIIGIGVIVLFSILIYMLLMGVAGKVFPVPFRQEAPESP